jgi:uncharacterized membrane protein YeaQ/YmgE (transglycosylase-associated protein family)
MGGLWSIITWALFGLVIGAIARLLYPGRQSMSIATTMVLGIVGSLIGGFISWLFGFDPQDGPFQGAGWIMSIVGGLIAVWIALAMNRRTTTRDIRRSV